jgi:exosortase E/protease (VPEID-CTERM system)
MSKALVNALSGASSFVVSAPTRRTSELALLALLVGEIVYLTVSFDSERLGRVPSTWMRVLDSSPLYLQLAISIAVATVLVGGRRFIAAIATLRHAETAAVRLVYLTAHVVSLVVFISLTGILFAAGSSVATHPSVWGSAWCLAGAVTLGSWALTLFPHQHWYAVMRDHRKAVGWGIVAGTAVWGSGFVTEVFWTHLARYTFLVVGWILRGIYSDSVSIPETLVVGTSSFKVKIAPECSGYEGVGMILAFLAIYLYVFRKDLRFPGALVLLPIGAIAMWVLNAVRIVALIGIGASGWHEVARGGFHSQAGWLVFNAVGLTLVAVINRGGYFMHPSRPRTIPATAAAADSTTAFVGPLVAMLAAAMVTGAVSAGFDWLYPARLAAAAFVMWRCWRAYSTLRWSCSLGAVAIGAVTFVVWIAMLPGDMTDKDSWPAVLEAMPSLAAAAWLALRVIGYVLVAPLAEELAFRGYAARRFINADIDSVPVGTFSWPSFLLSSLAFGAFHGRLWLAGTLAGMAFAYAVNRRRSFGDAVLAHGTTNALIVGYVFATGRWSAWS